MDALGLSKRLDATLCPFDAIVIGGQIGETE